MRQKARELVYYTFRFSAELLPRLAISSYSIVWPSLRVVSPAFCTAEIWTKMSLPAAGGQDIFVHLSAVQKAGLTPLNEGQTIEYEEIANRGRSSAENLKV